MCDTVHSQETSVPWSEVHTVSYCTVLYSIGFFGLLHCETCFQVLNSVSTLCMIYCTSLLNMLNVNVIKF